VIAIAMAFVFGLVLGCVLWFFILKKFFLRVQMRKEMFAMIPTDVLIVDQFLMKHFIRFF